MRVHAEQLDLAFGPPETESQARRRRAWEEFHEANPEVYRRFARLALDEIEAGEPRVGPRMVWEVLRWRLKVEKRRVGRDPYRLNDHLLSFMVRKFIADHPEHRRCFELRRGGA